MFERSSYSRDKLDHRGVRVVATFIREAEKNKHSRAGTCVAQSGHKERQSGIRLLNCVIFGAEVLSNNVEFDVRVSYTVLHKFAAGRNERTNEIKLFARTLTRTGKENERPPWEYSSRPRNTS